MDKINFREHPPGRLVGQAPCGCGFARSPVRDSNEPTGGGVRAKRTRQTALGAGGGFMPGNQVCRFTQVLAAPLLTGIARVAGTTSARAARQARLVYMKASIIITPKKAVLDPQGKTIQGALEHMGYPGITEVRVGKYLEVELSGVDRETARRQLDEACHRFLSNPVIEDYRLEIHD